MSDRFILINEYDCVLNRDHQTTPMMNANNGENNSDTNGHSPKKV
jgi:hypothetical protein